MILPTSKEKRLGLPKETQIVRIATGWRTQLVHSAILARSSCAQIYLPQIHTTGLTSTGLDRYAMGLRPSRRRRLLRRAADVGWVTGHSYIVYGPLLAGTTTVMYSLKERPTSRSSTDSGTSSRSTRSTSSTLRPQPSALSLSGATSTPPSTTSPPCASWVPSASPSTPQPGNGITVSSAAAVAPSSTPWSTNLLDDDLAAARCVHLPSLVRPRSPCPALKPTSST